MCGRTRTLAPRRRRRPDDVLLEAEVDDRDERSALPGLADLTDCRGRDLRHEVLVLPARDGPGSFDGAVGVDLAWCGDDAAETARGPEVPREGPRVDPRDRRDALGAQERCELPGVLEDRRCRVGHHERAEPRLRRLVVVPKAAVVADERVGHDDHLAGIRGIGADLLVAGLRGVDDEVAARRDVRSEGDPWKDRSRPRGRASQAHDGRFAGRRSEPGTGSGGRTSAGPGTAVTNETHRPVWLGGRARIGSDCLLPGLTGPVRRPHGTGLQGWRQRSTVTRCRAVAERPSRGPGGVRSRPPRPASRPPACPGCSTRGRSRSCG